MKEEAASIVVRTGTPVSTAFLLIRYSSYSMPTYFSIVDVDGILIMKSILCSSNKSDIFGLRFGSLIL